MATAPDVKPTTPAESGYAVKIKIAWGWVLVGLIAGEALLLLLSNLGNLIANKAFGESGASAADGGIVGVSTLVAVIVGGYIAAKKAGRQ
ncbi:MAG: hypothetical protein JOZ75_09695, partial [Candidatus Dormibacteraeota bacterium]|nr:hypothetical protein [Candidatus Dormibacteraeota bacterium]